jgi:hypothetical protein
MKNMHVTHFIRGFLFILFLMILTSFQICTAQSWTYVAGITAQDIAVGKNGSVWATGTNHAIYRWNGSSWETMPGGAERIAVDPDGAAWVVNLGGDIYKYNLTTRNWELKPGNAKDIAVGADGSVWVIGSNVVQGGYGIYKWNGSNWTNIPGGAVRIAVDQTGNAWVVNSSNNVFRYNGSSFELKPGGLKDIGVGANGTIWCTGTDERIYQWDGSNWKLKTGGASQVSVAPDGNAWVVNAGGQVYHTNDAATSVQIRTIFTRGQTYEYRMLQALKMYPYTSQVNLGGTAPVFSSIDPLGQAFGRLALQAAEIYFLSNPNITADQVLSQIGSYTDKSVRQSVSGIMAVLTMNAISKSATDVPTTYLKNWAANLYRSIKVRSAKAVLDEYQRWKSDWCTYEGISPEECRVQSQGIVSLFTTRKPPEDLLGKNGLKSVLANNADAIAVGTSLGLTVATTTAAAVALASVLGTTATVSTAGILTVTPNLCAAFVPAVSAGAAGGASAGGAIGAVGWAGVVAAPVAAAVLCIVVGTIEGFKVVEAAKLEPMLKMKLGAAMAEPIKISNVMADSSSRNMFFIAFMEAAEKNFQITEPRVDGEVRFYCQAGFVSSFRLSYTLNGQTVTKTTADLAVGHEESFPIPYNATNIRTQGWYLNAGWKDLFNVTLDGPTYICYTSYGTIFGPNYKTDCPEVGNMTTKANEVTITQGGGYSAWIRLTYVQNGQTVTLLDQSSTAAGWRKVFTIPVGVTNVRLQAWSSTGLVWDPWKTIIDKTWPYPPNECIKVYGTTLDPKWNNECN